VFIKYLVDFGIPVTTTHNVITLLDVVRGSGLERVRYASSEAAKGKFAFGINLVDELIDVHFALEFLAARKYFADSVGLLQIFRMGAFQMWVENTAISPLPEKESARLSRRVELHTHYSKRIFFP